MPAVDLAKTTDDRFSAAEEVVAAVPNDKQLTDGSSSESDPEPEDVPSEEEDFTNSTCLFSGVFYNNAATGDLAYAAFSPDLRPLPVPSLSFLPEPIAVMASTAGLICCRGLKSNIFYICNPLTTAWVALPEPSMDGDPVAALLVPDEVSADGLGNLEYHLVFTYPIKDDVLEDVGIYAIEYFDSREWKWTISVSIIDADKEKIVPESGVAAGGAAYWRTGTGTVVVYVPSTDDLLVTVPPDDSVRWELGEMGGRLCCISLKGTKAVVSVLEDGLDKWKEETIMDVGPDWRVLKEEDFPSPLRSQGAIELLFCEGLTYRDGRQVVARNMATHRARRLSDNRPQPQPGDVLVPYVSSLVHFKRERINLEYEGKESIESEVEEPEKGSAIEDGNIGEEDSSKDKFGQTQNELGGSNTNGYTDVDGKEDVDDHINSSEVHSSSTETKKRKNINERSNNEIEQSRPPKHHHCEV